jgi:hypothetical protein
MVSDRISELDDRGLRDFALTMAAIVAVLFGLVLPWVLNVGWPMWPWIFAAVFAFWGFTHPASLSTVYRLWMKFGLVLNRITTPLVLAMVFFLVFTPIALFMRIIGRNTMARRAVKSATTYRKASRARGKESMEKPY